MTEDQGGVGVLIATTLLMTAQLERSPLWQVLQDTTWMPAQFYERLRGPSSRNFARGDKIVRRGQKIEWLGLLTRGRLRIYIEGIDEDVLLCTCPPGFVVGFDSVIRNIPTRVEIEASTESSMLILAAPLVRHLAQKEAVFSNALMRALMAQVDYLFAGLRVLSASDAQTRMNAALEHLAHVSTTRKGWHEIEGLSQEDIALLCRTGRSTLNRYLRALERSGHAQVEFRRIYLRMPLPSTVA